MSNKAKIRRLEDAGIDEATIVATLEAELHPEHPFAEVRSKLRNPQELLSKEARQEIFYITGHDHMSVVLQKMYRTTAAEIYKAKHIVRARRERAEASLVIETYNRLGTIEETATELETSVRHVSSVVRAATPRSTHDEATILLLLKAGMTYHSIHEDTGTNVSTIGRIARANGLSRQVQRKNMDNWPEILAYAEKHSVSEAARHYNVERSNIYYHKSKEQQ